MTYDTNNVFAKILRKELACQSVDETDYSLAFRDKNPTAPLHILVIPKGPYTTMTHFIDQASKHEIKDFFDLVRKVMKEQRLWGHPARLIINQGEKGGQEIPHFHVHLLGGWEDSDSRSDDASCR